MSFLLPFAQMAYAASGDPEAGLPACCRSHGKHKCFMRMVLALHRASDKPAASTPQVSERCPWTLGGTSSVSASRHLILPDGHSIAPDCDPAALPKAIPASARVSFQARANHKRGPPSFSIFA